jgi:membrane-bound serine protease (ClpP class)
MKTFRRFVRGSAFLVALAAALPAAAAHVNVITISGSINPASSDHIQSAIAQTETDGGAVLLIELDTPGGLLASTKDIIQAILNAGVPVVVFVSPRGAWAASAGTFITLAGHVAAMAPGTSIGAASPVSASGGGGERGEDDERRPRSSPWPSSSRSPRSATATSNGRSRPCAKPRPFRRTRPSSSA